LLTRFNAAYLGSDEDGNPANGHQASSGDLNGNQPGVYGLFNAQSAIADGVGAVDGLPDDLLDGVSYASQIIFNVVDPTSLAFADDLDTASPGRTYVDGDGSIITDLLNERSAIVDYQTVYGIGSVRFTGTIEELYDTSVTVAGGAAATASNQLVIAQDREQQINEAVANLSGVSLDEELAKLINFQRAFEASARMIRVGDELLSQILTLVG
jgi:flagellar hook-associated protein 1 FlgK